MNDSTQNRYHQRNIDMMESVYGPGYMSVGGNEEVARIVAPVSINDQTVLDVGCGLGGAVVTLARDHGARQVTGIDIDAGVLVRAAELVAAAKVADRVTLTRFDPGPLPFAANSFDVVYITAVSCHLADLSGLFRDACRILRPGGSLVGGEWFKAGDNEAFRQWDGLLRERGLNFYFVPRPEFEHALCEGGLAAISIADRTAATEQLAQGYLRRVEVELRDSLLASLGGVGFGSLLDWTRSRVSCLTGGGMHYGHFHARKPG